MMKPALMIAVSLALFSGAARAQMGPPQPLPAEVLADEPDIETATYLRANVVAEGPLTGCLTLAFPASFYENRLFLLAESHGYAAPQVVDLQLLAHLNARIGLRDYLGEMDPVQASRLNTYLDEGDEGVLDRVFDLWTSTGAQWGNSAFRDKVRAVRRLNQTLPPERRVRFLGIDSIHDWSLLRDWIEARGGRVDPRGWATPDARARSKQALKALETLQGESDDEFSARLVELLRLIAAGTDRGSIIFASYSHAVSTRELGDRPSYGLWGMFHALQGPVNGALPFAARVVRSKLPTRDRVTTIALLPLDSAVQLPIPSPTGIERLRLTGFNIDGPFVKAQGSATLRAASDPDRTVIFDLSRASSPVKPGDFLTIQTSVGQNFLLDPDVPTAIYAQYLGVFRGSDWAPPIVSNALPEVISKTPD